MSRSTVGTSLVGVAWDDGDHNEPHRLDDIVCRFRFSASDETP
jgi:hypothetical protein